MEILNDNAIFIFRWKALRTLSQTPKADPIYKDRTVQTKPAKWWLVASIRRRVFARSLQSK
ncbi:hypothetical protein FJY90_05290 [Candidatus Gottesmanbacteria bacterium]|nr:hypothetical protein [Candidatus Gottesmanbacteria bacterium]